MSESRVTLLGPNYLMYCDESGKTRATAVFSAGAPPNTQKIPLSTNTFVKVGGMGIGSPQLLSIEITGAINITVVPNKDLITGP